MGRAAAGSAAYSEELEGAMAKAMSPRWRSSGSRSLKARTFTVCAVLQLAGVKVRVRLETFGVPVVLPP